jgi:hypothetical protein
VKKKGKKQADFGEVARRGQVQLLLKGKQNSQQHPGENTTKTVSSPVKIHQKQRAIW